LKTREQRSNLNGRLIVKENTTKIIHYCIAENSSVNELILLCLIIYSLLYNGV